MQELDFPRLIAVAGHYGSGKTTVAVNLAMSLAGKGFRTAIADFDIVNPYFRAADAVPYLKAAGVHCVIPEFANTNVDIASLPSEAYTLFKDYGGEPFDKVIFDVGGDDGASALSVYRRHFYREPYEMLYVCSMYRPLTAEPSEAVELLREIEARSGLVAGSIVNNSSLGAETTAETVAASEGYADEICRLAKLPLRFTSVLDTVGYKGANVFTMCNYTKSYF